MTGRQHLKPEEIRAIREGLGMTQAALAEAMGVQPLAISRWERGERQPDGPAVVLLALARAGIWRP